MADDAAVGDTAWTDPDNAKVSDNVYATRNGDGSYYSHYLKATNFGFSIPTGATINGILVEIEKKASANGTGIKDNLVVIVKSDGTFGTTNKAIAGNWATSDTYYSYGSSTDLWGENWTPAGINNANFGVAFSVWIYNAAWIASVDHIRITVYYTGAAAGPAKLKTWNGLAVAKIKTINGLAIAKVKTVNGLP
jgi:hypothetical protein